MEKSKEARYAARYNNQHGLPIPVQINAHIINNEIDKHRLTPFRALILEAEEAQYEGPLELVREAARRESLEENVDKVDVYDCNSFFERTVEYWEEGECFDTIISRLKKRLGLG